jgi:hypothetical protein
MISRRLASSLSFESTVAPMDQGRRSCIVDAKSAGFRAYRVVRKLDRGEVEQIRSHEIEQPARGIRWIHEVADQRSRCTLEKELRANRQFDPTVIRIERWLRVTIGMSLRS